MKLRYRVIHASPMRAANIAYIAQAVLMICHPRRQNALRATRSVFR